MKATWWRALPLLTLTLLRRLMRDGFVLRSLVLPTALTVVTLYATVLAVALSGQPKIVAVPRGFEDEVLTRIAAAHELRIVPADDPREQVRVGQALAATDGHTVWAQGPTAEAALVEAALRDSQKASWRLQPMIALPGVREGAYFGMLLGRLLAAVFALYAVVLGAGMVARDRDDGTLSAEFALPLPRWVHGASRWLASTIVVTAFLVPSLVVWDALMGIPAVSAAARHAIAACAAATAIGLFSVARAGPGGGFAGPLAAALSTTFGLFALGRVVGVVSVWVPIASLGTQQGGTAPLLLSLLFGAVAVWQCARFYGRDA